MSGLQSSQFLFCCLCFVSPDDFPEAGAGRTIFTRKDGCKLDLFLLVHALFVFDNRSGSVIHDSESVSR